MKSKFADFLVHPVTKSALVLEVERESSSGIDAGRLLGSSGDEFPITSGIPRFVSITDPGQGQTSGSFGYKWGRTETYESPAVRQAGLRWLLERYGFADAEEMRLYFQSKGHVLDLGCGSGYSSSLWMDGRWNGSLWVGVDISTAIDVAAKRLGFQPGTHFVQADALQLPFADGTFDAVFSEGVLHHTPSTRAALHTTVQVLRSGGELLFYVYRRKGPIREFSDDYVRAQLSVMSPDQAWETLRPLTRLGQVLHEAQTAIEIPEDVPFLGIRAGRVTVQRLFYWHVAKVYWNPDLTFDENHHVNFDWYHPTYAHRQSEEEVRAWCSELGLEIHRCDVQESGMTIRAIKQ